MRDNRDKLVIAAPLTALIQQSGLSPSYLLVSACNVFLMEEGAAAINYHGDKFDEDDYRNMYSSDADLILTESVKT
ncbi:unnamed protein product, partial [Brenthis ino]